MTRLDSLKKRIEELEKEIEALKGFRLTPSLKKFQDYCLVSKVLLKTKLPN